MTNNPKLDSLDDKPNKEKDEELDTLRSTENPREHFINKYNRTGLILNLKNMVKSIIQRKLQKIESLLKNHSNRKLGSNSDNKSEQDQEGEEEERPDEKNDPGICKVFLKH